MNLLYINLDTPPLNSNRKKDGEIEIRFLNWEMKARP